MIPAENNGKCQRIRMSCPRVIRDSFAHNMNFNQWIPISIFEQLSDTEAYDKE